MTTDNPWREFVENCINGNNYFRASEYRELLADLDRGYAALAEVERLRADLAAERDEVALKRACIEGMRAESARIIALLNDNPDACASDLIACLNDEAKAAALEGDK